MNRFLIALVMTLALAASVVVLVERTPLARNLPEDGQTRALERLESRLAALERKLAPAATPTVDALPSNAERAPLSNATGEPAGDNPTDPEVDPGAPKGVDPKDPPSLRGILARLTEIEGMVWDTERALRRDLKGVYERMEARFDEVLANGGSGGGSASPVEDQATKQAVIAKLSDMGIKILADEGMVEVKGQFGKPSRQLEFLAVAPGGRAHEALMVIDVVPSALKIAIETLGIPEAGEPDQQTLKYPDGSGKVYIYVLWDGLKKPRRVEDMILNSETNETLPRTPWMFTASYTYTDTRKWERRFAADMNRNLIALVWSYAAECLFACPLEETLNEQIWHPFPAGVPEPGTDLRVFFRKEPHAEWDKL